jgi:hypothetical protein
MRNVNLLLSVILLVATFNVEAKSPPPGTGVADVPANIYIMIDTSGSMDATVPSTNPLQMYSPRDVGVDSNGNIYVVEYYDHRIRKYDANGAFVRTFGTRGGRDGQMTYPKKIAIDSSDNVYVSDQYGRRIVKFNSDGQWQRNFNGMNGSAEGVAVDPSGNVYGNTRSKIFKWDSSGNILGDVAISDGYGIDWYGGSIYASERSARHVKKFSDSLVLENTWSVSLRPEDIVVTSNGIHYSVGGFTAQIHKLSLAGVHQKYWGGYYQSGGGRIYYLYGIGKDNSGNIYAPSYYDVEVKKYDSEGVYKYKWGFKETRMSEALKVIEKLTSSTELKKGAHFGMQDWHSYPTHRVNANSLGAGIINLSVQEKIMRGTPPVLVNNPDSKVQTWYRPRGGTTLSRAMTDAERYFMGTHSFTSPIDPLAGCQKNFLIVISDGQWNGDASANATASRILRDKGIETLVVGFHSGGNRSKYISLAKAGGTYPDSPLFSNNWQQLYETMSAYIRQAISSRLTFSAPVVMPNIASGDHIFQSTFQYKKDHQWNGHLSKFKLKTNGQIGDLAWDAGVELESKSESSRKIWTILPSVANSLSGSNSAYVLNNSFHTSNANELKTLFWPAAIAATKTNAQATKLIKFVRGIDAYDENTNGNSTEARWKLGDVYNSRLVVVGPVNSRVTSLASKENTLAFYRQVNDYKNFKAGSSCGNVKCGLRKEVVYVGANDGMLHAFDSATGEEIWAFIPPMMLKNLRDVESLSANKTNSIYGVDGSPMVKDIFYDNEWRTILIAGMGRGGYGYFALDITNPDIPEFLFAFENDPSDSVTYHWDHSGKMTETYYPPVTASIDSQYDYSKLGDALSVPLIVPMPYGSGTKWVAVFGAGYNAGVSTFYGSSIYVVDLENHGKVLKRIDVTDSPSSLTLANSVPADLVAINADTTSKAAYKGSMVYGADLEGKLWKLNLTDKGTLYEFTPLFNSEASNAQDRMEFFQITPSIGTDGKFWNFYGTGDQQALQRIDAAINNRLFGVKDNDFPSYASVTGLTNTASSVLKNVSASGSCPANTDLGWYVDLGANEKITGKIGLFNEVLYASRYSPIPGSICSPGVATLSEHDVSCGNVSRTTTLGGGIATGAVIHNNIIYVGISGTGSGSLKDDQGNIVGSKKNNLIVITPAAANAIGDGKITQESWREIY